ncbi:MAG: Ni/Fe-hydrogenase, b-type cytochrome subunit [Desulfuromonadaceae bacterium]|nr:Ni/Fe-hydrogenase, b-type cytochrome subunit [Desulfuromonadaceae bacterium]
MLELRYVWEWPVRITHWVNVVALVVLSVTGLYIGNPFISVSSTTPYVMGWMRFIHYVFAYLFLASFLARMVWMFCGNRYASWREYFPWVTAKGRKRIVGTFAWYTFLRKTPPYEVGHNALAVMAYAGVFALFLVQCITGFAIYGQFEPGSFWFNLSQPLLAVGNQQLRLTHHIIMWLLIGFGIHHVYSAALMDVKEKNGCLSSIFGGYKFVDPDEEVE